MPRPSQSPSKGLEYFFSKQKQSGSSAAKPGSNQNDDTPARDLTDEELARKLQAEWDQEIEGEQAGLIKPSGGSVETAGSASEQHHLPADSTDLPSESPTAPTLKRQAPRNTLSLQSVASAEDTVSAAIPLGESPLAFEPARYVPQLRESWVVDGGNASYAFLTRCFMLVNNTQSRIKIVDTLVNCVRVLIEADPASLLPAVRFPPPGGAARQGDLLSIPRCGWPRMRFLPRTSRSS